MRRQGGKKKMRKGKKTYNLKKDKIKKYNTYKNKKSRKMNKNK